MNIGVFRTHKRWDRLRNFLLPNCLNLQFAEIYYFHSNRYSVNKKFFSFPIPCYPFPVPFNMLTFSQIKQFNLEAVINFTLSLTAEQRTRSRHRFITEEGEIVCLRLPRGTILRDGDILLDDNQNYLARVIAKPEQVLTVYATKNVDLIKAAYHLGNRHVPLEITANYLRLSPDPVLRKMLKSLNLEIKEEIVPFQPQKGAYGDQTQHAH